MTHTSTEQPEALRLAEYLMQDESLTNSCNDAAAELIRLHARVQELEAENAHLKDAAWTAIDALEASQAQSESLTADEIKEPKDGANWRVVWWNESCRIMLPADKALDSFRSYKNGSQNFTLKRRSRATKD